ncbi:hypothetical protein PF005_g5283 [Phytophthora fragariae]|uniref:Uncharacterized protein n=1 Tax=Phytophthora fragariae TaxID=53985 RepID=A0A6A3JDH2_9STRA|nr:hypothetical protein PF011_g18682 [Phytophthora fragariae]KAE9226053.1 hypothetical protein PF005_g5283 [Phytophthora fragariae]KAE9247252.1 hypothetical protein PF004_g4417 [Phytophthora fragariae]KAE9248192.1 hypothetical protein PF002_g5914 [Phytophthora fragariae]
MDRKPKLKSLGLNGTNPTAAPVSAAEDNDAMADGQYGEQHQ